MTRPHPALTLGLAVVVFFGGILLGLRLVLADADPTTEEADCTSRSVAAGEPLTANLVEVDVLNASGREGQANRVSIDLQRRGFVPGAIANSTSAIEVPFVTILTDDPADPRIPLVQQQFGGEVAVAEPDIEISDRVTVVVGQGYANLAEGAPTEVPASRDIAVCVPVADL